MVWCEEAAVDAARSVVPVVFANRAVAEAGARMAPEVRAAMGGAGLFALAVPAAYGGREAPLPDLVAAVEVIGAVDPSAAWHLANTLSAPLAAACLPAANREAVFAGDLGRPFCVSNSPTGRARPLGERFELTGECPFVTGVLEAEWVSLAARLPDIYAISVGVEALCTYNLERGRQLLQAGGRAG